MLSSALTLSPCWAPLAISSQVLEVWHLLFVEYLESIATFVEQETTRQRRSRCHSHRRSRGILPHHLTPLYRLRSQVILRHHPTPLCRLRFPTILRRHPTLLYRCTSQMIPRRHPTLQSRSLLQSIHRHPKILFQHALQMFLELCFPRRTQGSDSHPRFLRPQPPCHSYHFLQAVYD